VTRRERLRLWTWQWLISVDQLAHVGVCFWTFVVLARGKCPDADETISSRVGRASLAGKAWAPPLERMINRLFVALGDRPDHCRRSVELLCRE